MNAPTPEEDTFSDLEELLDVPETADDSFGELDDLLEESLQYASDSEKLKEARKKLSKHNYANSAERMAIEEKVAAWELQRVWIPTASVIYFTVQHCNHCRSEHHHFTGYFQRQRHKVSSIDRWIASDRSQITATPTLPKEVKEVVESVPTCVKCFFRTNWEMPLDLAGTGASALEHQQLGNESEAVAAIVVGVTEEGNCND